MNVAKFGLDNHRLGGTLEQGLGNAIRHHRSTRLKIDQAMDAFRDDAISEDKIERLDGLLEKTAEGEEAARLAFLRYPVASLADARAKADHVRLLLAEGDELDKTELELLLLSMI